MTVDTFTTNPLLSNIMPAGEDRIQVLIGATVHLAAGQAAGNYTGSFTFTCNGDSDSANVLITLLAPISISSVGDSPAEDAMALWVGIAALEVVRRESIEPLYQLLRETAQDGRRPLLKESALWALRG